MQQEKIQQHFYTREKRGLYRPSEGYDTVAKSPGLADEFVKQQLHPYCTYSGGGQDALTVAHFSCGRMLLGKASYVSKDFTGQRSAFFAHNYILPALTAGGVLGELELLQSVQFAAENNIALDELTNLPTSPTPSNHDCNSLEISQEAFAHIAQCVVQSICGARKTYVIAPPQAVFNILAGLYKGLPEIFRQLLGFCTHAREPEKREGIHLVFLDKAALNATKSRFSGDFLINIEKNASPDYIPLDADYIAQQMQTLPPERFFCYMQILNSRRVATHDLCENWLRQNMEKLTLRQLAAVPANFLNIGKNSTTPAIFITLSILKTVAQAVLANRQPETRYLLGSYRLSQADKDYTLKLIQPLCYGTSERSKP